MVDALYTKIQPVAAKDNTVWKRGDGSRGYKQITEEFIPIRGKQLLQVNTWTVRLIMSDSATM
jgi:hypothetical protein